MSGVANARLRWSAHAAIALVAAVVIAGATGAAPAAAADGPQILVSSDGVTFAPTLPRDLFSGMELLVPGGSVSSRLWIRNPTTSPAELRIGVRDLVIPSPAYGRSVTLSMTDSASGQTRSTPLSAIEACSAVVPSVAVPAGATTQLEITFSMGDLDGVDGQGQHATMSLALDMRDASAGPYPSSPCVPSAPSTASESANTDDPGAATADSERPGRRDGFLAKAGLDMPSGVAFIGFGMVLAGLALSARRRLGRPR